MANQQKTGGSGAREKRPATGRGRLGAAAAHEKSRQSLSLPTAKGRGGLVRIVGGRFKRTPLAVGDREGLRPTPDRVRETVFDWLTHLMGGIDGLKALDMFAGSGAMGLEAVSRGACHADIVELDRRGAAAIRATAEKLGASQVHVHNADVFSFLERTAVLYDLIFIDPPFAANLQERALRAVGSHLATGALVYLESPEEYGEEKLAQAGFESVRRGKAGAVHYLLAQLKEL